MNKRDFWIPFGIAAVVTTLGILQVVQYKVEQEEEMALRAARPAAWEFARSEHDAKMIETPSPLGLALKGLGATEPKVRAESLARIDKILVGKERKAIGIGESLKLGESLIAYYTETGEEGKTALNERRLIMRLIATKVRPEQAKGFFQDVMTFGSEPMKVAAARTLSMRGSVNDRELSEKGFVIAKSSAFPSHWKARAYRRFLGRKAAEPVILELFQREDLGAEGLRRTAVEIQNFNKVDLMGAVLSRLDEAGLLDNSSRMPWMSGKLLSKHIKESTGDELLTALRVVHRRPALLKTTAKSVKERLGDASPLVRRVVAKMLPEVLESLGVDSSSGERLLTARLQIETDPQVKKDIELSLAQVRSQAPSVPAP